MSDTLASRLTTAAIRAPNLGLRFVDRHEREARLDWPEVVARATRTAGGLRARGVRAGDPVVIILPTGPEFFDVFFAAWFLRATPVPLYPPIRLGRLTEYHDRTVAMIEAVRGRIIVTNRQVWRILGETVERARVPLGCVRAEELAGEPTHEPSHQDDLALVQFSSGTTVEPKPVALSHRNLVENVRAITGWMFSTGEPLVEGGVSWLPLYHDMGLIGCVGPAIYRPGFLTLIPPELFVTRPGVWLRTLSRTRAMISPAPNFAYALCVDRVTDEELEGVDLSGWRFALNGAEPVAPETLRRFMTRFARWGLRPDALTPVYGLAEATLGVTFSAPGAPFHTTRFDRRALAEGRAVPTADGVELVDLGEPLEDIEVDVPEGRVGTVRVRGPSVMVGYLHQPERTARAIEDGWLDTGDLGFFHEGHLYLTGRAKDVLILRGRNHAPQEVEHALDRLDGVRTGCSAAVSHRPEGADHEQLVVFVEARSGVEGLADRCREAVLEATGLQPDLVVLLEPGTLPRTSSGKIRRGEALRRWLAEELVPPDKVTPWHLAGALARGTLAHWRARFAAR